VRPSRSDSLERIGGLHGIKDEVQHSILLPLRHPNLFRARQVRPPRGFLLCGPPGTGKTMLARAIASESDVPFLALHAAALENKYFGESPKILAASFRLARKVAPCIVFFDEIDGIGRARSDSDQSCVYSMKCELLRHLDGTESNDGVVILACTNCEERLDPALRRRFGRVLRIGRPREDERYDILRTITRADRCSTKTLRHVAHATAGCSGADLAALYAEAAERRLRASGLREKIEGGRITTEEELLRRLRPLTVRDWLPSGAQVNQVA
jgi:ATP-dependent 26S proteasome regulatory subunit